MKKFLLTIGFLFALAIAAQAQSGCVELREIDGTPDVKCVKIIRVTNGTLSCTGTTCTITISGGGGGSPGGADTNVQFNDSASFGGNSGFVYDKTSKISLGVAGASVGAIGFRNATSGTITLQPVTGALGTVTLSLPAATDTLVGKATTDILSNKTLASPSVTGNISAATTSLLFFGSNYYRYINGTGPAMYDTTTDKILTFNVQSLTGNRTVTWPDTALTVAGINVANNWSAGVKQTFAPNGTTAGINVGSVAGDPSAPANGDLWYDSTANELTARINGANVALGAGSSGITVGTTTVTSGTATRLFYETAGNVVGQVSGVTSDGTNVTAGSGNLRATSPRITTSILDTNGNTLLGITANGSATEYITIANNTATNAVSLTASSPTVAASAQAGTPFNLTASPAIAGNVNVGAAAGGNVTITAGNAARLTSGNANGGNINLTTGAGIGTGTRGQVLLTAGNAGSAPALAFTGNTNYGFDLSGTTPGIVAAGSLVMYWGASNAVFNTTGTFFIGGTADTGFTRSGTATTRLVGNGFLIGASGSIGTSGVGVLAIANGTAPSSRPADEFQFYAADYAAGDSRANILSESNATPVTIGNHSVLTGYQHLTKTADYTVVTADSNAFFDNAGAGAGVVFTLPTPTASPSLKYTFCRVANQTVTVDIGGSVTIRGGASVTTSGGNVTLDAVGTCLTIYSVSSTEWYASATLGTLTFN